MNGTGIRAVCCLLIWAGLTIAPADAADPDGTVDFQRDIRPLLSDACFHCHGPDENHREADLRLDTRAGAFKARDGHAAIVPGKLEESEIWRRITSDDPDERMPPADSGKSLSPQQIDLFKRWIEQGAAWSQHWAFVAPQRPVVPQPEHGEWVRNPIDAFVANRLEQQQLSPSPEADRITLLRRLSLDLVGLPPTLAELDAYLADTDTGAYERQVDRLLQSPHYGERWGRHWLDAARYADSDGFEKDKPRFVWFYRDWVINAFNRDLPYDQFIVEQIAGDLLPNATQDQIVATGFLRNSMINEEGGIDPEQFRMEAMFDRMDAIGKSILGLTIQCAQCHNHKYDPLTQEEYYRMFAFLNNSHEGAATVYSVEQQEQRRHVLTQIEAIEHELQLQHPDWQQRMAAWEADVRAATQSEWEVVELEFDDKSIGGQKFIPQEDGSYLAQGYAPTKFRPQMTFTTQLQGITALRLELLNDPNLPHNGPGRSITGTGALSEINIQAAPVSEPDKSEKIKIVEASADVSVPESPLPAAYDDRSKTKRILGPIAFAIDGKNETAWGIDVGPGRRNQPRKAVFRFEKPVSLAEGAMFTVHLAQMHGGWNSDDNQTHNLGRFRISVTRAADVKADPLPAEVRRILTESVNPHAAQSTASTAEQPTAAASAAVKSTERRERTPQETATVFRYWRGTVADWQEANSRIEELWKQHPEGASQLVLKEREERRMTHRLERGDFLKPADQVTPGVPAVLHALSTDSVPPRLSFAKWLADRKSPTTARSMVNRVWQAYFGTGLVSTSEDLGLQSESPTHPQLLDWLAVEFMDEDWSLKKLHRLIVTSATYRQTSRVTSELQSRDPYNRLLARGTRFRVEAEVVRDIALAASGLLNRDIGGPSVYPPAPAFLFEPPASYGPKIWKQEAGPDRYRRGVYTFRFRSVPYPVLQTFDAPNGDAACVRRSRSNTPLQALTTLNEPLFMECARELARRTVTDGGATDDGRLQFAFQRCLTRTPTPAESKLLLDLLQSQTERFSGQEAAAWELATGDKDARIDLPEGITAADLAAWTAVSRVLLNLDETITRE